MTDVPSVLFLSVHGSGRSIAAKVLMAHYSEGRVVARSAGTEPAEVLNKSIVKVLKERDLDTSREFPTPPEFDMVRASDVIVTMDTAGALPDYADKRYVEWDVVDPWEASVAECRPIIDDLEDLVQALLAELSPS